MTQYTIQQYAINETKPNQTKPNNKYYIGLLETIYLYTNYQFFQLWVKLYHCCSTTRMGLALNNPQRLTKKPNQSGLNTNNLIFMVHYLGSCFSFFTKLELRSCPKIFHQELSHKGTGLANIIIKKHTVSGS